MARDDRDQPVLVPVRMEALVLPADVRSDQKAEPPPPGQPPPPPDPQKWVNLSPYFALFGRGDPLGHRFAPMPLVETQNPLELKAGIHLHWALPAALTHGIQPSSGERIVFPQVPNRWLVMRIESATKRPDNGTVAWILESDYLDPQKGTSFRIVEDNRRLVRSKVGRPVLYESWNNAQSNGTCELTALAPGDPAFAAFYPGCRNVFGFHDPLSDRYDPKKPGTFTYLVAGWYSRPEDDPLNPSGAMKGRLGEFRGKWPLASVPADGYPERTLCHSAVHSVQWPGQGKPYHTPDAIKSTVTVAVGNTAIEALSAHIRKVFKSTNPVESLLSAFQYDMLSNPQTIPGLPEIDTELHRRGFFPVAGNAAWVIRRAETQPPSPGKKEPQPIPAFPESAAEDFGALNDAQRELNEKQRELASLQWKYYSLWWKNRVGRKPRDVDAEKLRHEVETAMKKLERDIHTVQSRISALAGETGTIKQLENKIISLPAFQGSEPDYELLEQETPRFWQANHPAILLAGPGINPSQNPSQNHSQKYSQEDDSDHLPCRILSQVATGLRLGFDNQVLHPAKDGDRRVDLERLSADPEWRFPLNAITPDFPFEACKVLFYETLLLDPASADKLAARAYQEQDITAAPLIKKNLVEDIETVIGERSGDSQQCFTNASDNAILPPPFIARPWNKNDWNPLFMVWEIEWRSSYAEPGKFDLARDWEFQANTDYRSKQDQPVEKSEQTYWGWAPLDPSVGRIFRERVAKAGTSAVEKFETQLGQLFLTQSLNGLNNALIMRAETLQLPPLDDGWRIVDDVLKLIGGSLDCSPRPEDKFFPIRAGHMRISRLWIVDAFGRAKRVVDDKDGIETEITVAEALTGQIPPKDRWIPLPPRIMQPARLSFSGLSARQPLGTQIESDSNPATSPICGWIVANRFDKCLVVFDAEGRVQGQLQMFMDKTELAWSSYTVVLEKSEASEEDRPSSRERTRLSWASVPDDPNTEPVLDNSYLQGFIGKLKALGAPALMDLMTLIDRRSLCITTEAQPTQSLSALVGQPLALVRASLQLKLWGHPATDQSWTQTTTANSRGFTKIKFPLWLGDMRKGKDGLIGYFHDHPEGAAKAYGRIRPACGIVDRSSYTSGYVDFDSTLELSLADPPAMITLLVDPRAAVQASSGILPTQLLDLAPYRIADILEDMDFIFRVGPLIGSPERLRIPLPEDINGDWTWGHFSGSHLADWQTDSEVGEKPSGPVVPEKPVQVYEGWLTLSGGLKQK